MSEQKVAPSDDREALLKEARKLNGLRVEHNLKVQDIADRTGYLRTYVSQVYSGPRANRRALDRIREATYGLIDEQRAAA